MNGLKTYTQAACGVISSWLHWFIGEYDNLLYALVTCMVLNCLSELMCMFVDRKRFHKMAVKNILIKILIFGIVGVCHVLDAYVIGTGSVLRTGAILFYISTEGKSLLKNAVYLGLPIPQPLKAALEQLCAKANQAEDEESEDDTPAEAPESTDEEP